MSGSRIAKRQSRNHARYRGRNDINIVPMLDVMIILIFFLIFTAVFSKMNILELNLPVDGGPPPELPAILELEVIVRADVLEVADRNTGLLQRLPNLEHRADYVGLSNYLRRVKIRFPEKKDATVLLEADIPYDTMVQTMDTMKAYDAEIDGQPVRGELFPQISVGDAPVAVPAARVAQR
jgi:biopolymer transport protein ExbD